MKKFTQCICALIIIALLIPITAVAAENAEQRASEFFMSDSCYLYKTSSTEFDICFDVTGTGMMDEIGAKTVKLQRSTDGINWTTIETFAKEDYPDMTDTDSSFHAWEYSYSGSAGYYYRAYVQFYAKDGGSSGSLGRYTSKIKI